MRNQKLDVKIFQDVLTQYLQSSDIDKVCKNLVAYIVKSKSITLRSDDFNDYSDKYKKGFVLTYRPIRNCIVNALYHEMKLKYGSLMEEFPKQNMIQIFNFNYPAICLSNEDKFVEACFNGLKKRESSVSWEDAFHSMCDEMRDIMQRQDIKNN